MSPKRLRSGSKRSLDEPEGNTSDATSHKKQKTMVSSSKSEKEPEPHKEKAVTEMNAAEIAAGCLYYANRSGSGRVPSKKKVEHEEENLYVWRRLFMLNKQASEMHEEVREVLKGREMDLDYAKLKRVLHTKLANLRISCAKVNYQAEPHNKEEPWNPGNADAIYESRLQEAYMDMRRSKVEPHESKYVSDLDPVEACEAAKHIAGPQLDKEKDFRKKLDNADTKEDAIKLKEDLLKRLKRLFALAERLKRIEQDDWPNVFVDCKRETVEANIQYQLRRMAKLVRFAFEFSEAENESDLPDKCLDMTRDPHFDSERKFRNFFYVYVLRWKLSPNEQMRMVTMLPSELKEYRIRDALALGLQDLKDCAKSYTGWQWPTKEKLHARQRKALALAVWKRVFALHSALRRLQDNNKSDDSVPQMIRDLVQKETELVKAFEAAHKEAHAQGEAPKGNTIEFDCETGNDSESATLFWLRYQELLDIRLLD